MPSLADIVVMPSPAVEARVRLVTGALVDAGYPRDHAEDCARHIVQCGERLTFDRLVDVVRRRAIRDGAFEHMVTTMVRGAHKAMRTEVE